MGRSPELYGGYRIFMGNVGYLITQIWKFGAFWESVAEMSPDTCAEHESDKNPNLGGGCEGSSQSMEEGRRGGGSQVPPKHP